MLCHNIVTVILHVVIVAFEDAGICLSAIDEKFTTDGFAFAHKLLSFIHPRYIFCYPYPY
jgi:hypothetical protein